MDYNEIAFAAKQKKVTLSTVAEASGLKSRQGLQSTIDGKTMQWKNIEMLCRFLDISPNELFGWKDEAAVSGNYAAHITGGCTQNSNEAIKAMRDQLKEKDKQIDRLIRIIEKNKLTK